MKILNRHNHKIPEDSIYIGRPSKWGNPYRGGIDGTRKEVIEMYENYVRNSNIINDLHELYGKDLVCSSVPLPCHGDVLIKLINEQLNDELKDYS